MWFDLSPIEGTIPKKWEPYPRKERVERRPTYVTQFPERTEPLTEKWCGKCGCKHPVSEFSPDGVTKLGFPKYQSYCKPQMALLSKAYKLRKKNAAR